jgi:hypothetical protein
MHGGAASASSSRLHPSEGSWPMPGTCWRDRDPSRPVRAETGEARSHNALALAEPRGMRPLVAHCRLGLGKLYQPAMLLNELQRQQRSWPMSPTSAFWMPGVVMGDMPGSSPPAARG